MLPLYILNTKTTLIQHKWQQNSSSFPSTSFGQLGIVHITIASTHNFNTHALYIKNNHNKPTLTIIPTIFHQIQQSSSYTHETLVQSLHNTTHFINHNKITTLVKHYIPCFARCSKNPPRKMAPICTKGNFPHKST